MGPNTYEITKMPFHTRHPVCHVVEIWVNTFLARFWSDDHQHQHQRLDTSLHHLVFGAAEKRQVLVKCKINDYKERVDIKKELFHLVLAPKFPTNLMNKFEALQDTHPQSHGPRERLENEEDHYTRVHQLYLMTGFLTSGPITASD
ncbi:hypothetical protein llap_8775 [Limosa lapponica baueri]|uniref:Uncharacterized protein n=1 Tax=Limosa lapponica baueri TaxID=1758121 RepID=A0A2I0U4A0_LIMLA|nr:hypothetical protein llap_8775 [Limosa lapponica baueri]